MAFIGDVLHHLVEHARGLGPETRQHFHAAIDDAFPPEPETAEASGPAPDPSGG